MIKVITRDNTITLDEAKSWFSEFAKQFDAVTSRGNVETITMLPEEGNARARGNNDGYIGFQTHAADGGGLSYYNYILSDELDDIAYSSIVLNDRFKRSDNVEQRITVSYNNNGFVQGQRELDPNPSQKELWLLSQFSDFCYTAYQEDEYRNMLGALHNMICNPQFTDGQILAIMDTLSRDEADCVIDLTSKYGKQYYDLFEAAREERPGLYQRIVNNPTLCQDAIMIHGITNKYSTSSQRQRLSDERENYIRWLTICSDRTCFGEQYFENCIKNFLREAYMRDPVVTLQNPDALFVLRACVSTDHTELYHQKLEHLFESAFQKEQVLAEKEISREK